MHVVTDPNVLLSTLLLTEGSLTWLRNAWKSELIYPLTSRQTIMELIRTLTYPKFDLTPYEQQVMLADYLAWCEPVTISKRPEIPECGDSNDRCFLELALVGNARALIPGDGDLLSLDDDFAIPIITPAEFQSRLNAAD